MPAAPAALSYCSNDYLGLAGRPGTREQAGSGASRLVYGDLPIYARLEKACAELVRQPEALTFTSGYAANVGLLSALVGPGDLIVSDALNHASIVDGARLSRARITVVPHLDVAATERAVIAGRGGRVLVVTESYFSMDADSPDLAGLRRVCDAHGAALLVDEAHALGVLGPEGRGLCAEVGVRADAVVGTFGKAFGAAGAFVAGCPALTAWLWNRARPFVFSTGLSPALAASALEGLRRAEGEPERRRRVLEVAGRMRSGMLELGVQLRGHGPIMPWVIGEAAAAVAVAETLCAGGFDVRAIRPPSVPEGTARLRLTLTAAHGAEDVDAFLGAVKRLRETGVLLGPSPGASSPGLLSGEPERPAAISLSRAALIVVTGTGTGIGKTHIAEAILRAWARHRPGARLIGLKPIESGVSVGAVTDSGRLAAASTFHVKQSGYALSAPLSPHLAARQRGHRDRPGPDHRLGRAFAARGNRHRAGAARRPLHTYRPGEVQRRLAVRPGARPGPSRGPRPPRGPSRRRGRHEGRTDRPPANPWGYTKRPGGARPFHRPERTRAPRDGGGPSSLRRPPGRHQRRSHRSWTGPACSTACPRTVEQADPAATLGAKRPTPDRGAPAQDDTLNPAGQRARPAQTPVPRTPRLGRAPTSPSALPNRRRTQRRA